ncbi:hypothetical protein [Flavobacterium zepuense]|nr:hypothetical protein [Flavobacterium zepuense]
MINLKVLKRYLIITEDITNKLRDMKMMPMSNESLEQFIKQFLPEGVLAHNENLELMSISKLIARVYQTVNESDTVEIIFNAFYNLRYPMSVVEPVHESRKFLPYLTTNSHRIYVAIDSSRIIEINNLLEIAIRQEPLIPSELKDAYRNFSQFMSNTAS